MRVARLALMGRLALVVGLFALTAGPTATGCSSTTANQSTPDADDGSYDTAACTAAGGQCVIGNVSCAVKGTQSCGEPGPAGTFCCLDANPQSDGGEDSGPNACIDDAGVKLIQASDYDQSCTVDTDCRLIGEGNACVPCAFACGLGAAINVSSLAQYNADVANTPAVEAKFGGLICASACAEAFGPCCVGGKCRTSTTSQCPGAATDAGDAAADTGADAATDGATDGSPLDAGGG